MLKSTASNIIRISVITLALILCSAIKPQSHSGNSTIGLSVAGKMDFLFRRHNGLEISIFTNINSLKSITGLGLYFVFSKWKG
jgi:hypothetical protein